MIETQWKQVHAMMTSASTGNWRNVTAFEKIPDVVEFVSSAQARTAAQDDMILAFERGKQSDDRRAP